MLTTVVNPGSSPTTPPRWPRIRKFMKEEDDNG